MRYKIWKTIQPFLVGLEIDNVWIGVTTTNKYVIGRKRKSQRLLISIINNQFLYGSPDYGKGIIEEGEITKEDALRLIRGHVSNGTSIELINQLGLLYN
ncbi:MAG: hypothetical protein J6I84_04350 [Bacilli bacterium]|nr:hypothetical protein [Bacilli bacterium]